MRRLDLWPLLPFVVVPASLVGTKPFFAVARATRLLLETGMLSPVVQGLTLGLMLVWFVPRLVSNHIRGR